MSAARAAVLGLCLAACGGDGGEATPDAAIDAAVDAGTPPNPFEGMFDGPEDFPRTGCRAGALAGFALEHVWPTLGVRTAVEGGALVTYKPDDLDGEDRAIPHTLTADDLMWRVSRFAPLSERWRLDAVDVCDVLPDGTLVGHRVACVEQTAGPFCFAPEPFMAPPLRRSAGEAEAGGGLALAGELALEGRPLNVRVVGGVAYLPMGRMGMRIVSAVNPAAPVKVGWWLPAEPNYYNDVKLTTVGGRRLAVLAGSPSDVVDVTDPAAPFLVARLTSGAHTVAVEGAIAYFVGGGNGLEIFDLSTPAAPVRRAELGLWMGDAGGHDLFVQDGRAYVSVPYAGLSIVDVTDPSNPVEGDRATQAPTRYWHSPWITDAGGRRIALHGDEGRDGRLTIIDLDAASPTYLQEIGGWTPRPLVSLHNVMARGARAYLAHYQDGVRVFDLADPTQPALLAYFNTWREEQAVASGFSGAIGIDLDPLTRRIYVADTIRGLLVLSGDATVFP